MVSLLLGLAAIGVAGWIFVTTDRGRRVLASFGLDHMVKGGVPREDRDFLLQSCGGDRAAVERLLEAERAKFPDLSEPEIHRRAIRIAMRERDERTEGSA